MLDTPKHLYLTLKPSLLYQIVRVERLRFSIWVFRKINYFLKSNKQLSFPENTELQDGLLKSSVTIAFAAFLISVWHLYGIVF